MPEWMTKERTVLIMKDPEKGATTENYRPMMCLPVMWKLLTGIIAEDLYEFLDTENLLPDEQKECRKNSQGTKDQLYIDKMVLKEVKSRKKNIAMGWIDYKKAYDVVPHSWILKLFGAAENIRSLLENSMKSWRTELTSNGQSLGSAPIKEASSKEIPWPLSFLWLQ